MTEKEFKKLKVGDKIKAVMQICYDLNPPSYIELDAKGIVTSLTRKQAMVWCDFGSKYSESIPCVAFEVDND